MNIEVYTYTHTQKTSREQCGIYNELCQILANVIFSLSAILTKSCCQFN